MSSELPKDKQALPVLKVLHRNTRRMQAVGGRKKEVLHTIEAAELPTNTDGGDLLREATRKKDMTAAERTFAALAKGPIGEAYNHLQFSVQDEVDVHRVVLAWRSWAILDLTGKELASTMLRQSVRYCVSEGAGDQHEIRNVLPKLLDQYKLLGKQPGKQKAEHLEFADASRPAGGRNPGCIGSTGRPAGGAFPRSPGQSRWAIGLSSHAAVS
jgi:hypothetical protein